MRSFLTPSLKLIGISTHQDRISNCVYMTFVFKIKRRFPYPIVSQCEVLNEISKMLCFNFTPLGKWGWADCMCKTIEQTVVFFVENSVHYELPEMEIYWKKRK